MKRIYSLAAATLVSAASPARAAEAPTEAGSSKFGMTYMQQQGCALLFGACDGERQTLAVRLGDAAARKEAVLAHTRFDEQTHGGVGRILPVTFRGRHYGAIDYALGGSQHLQGTVYSLIKSFPLGADGVVTLGGYVGDVTATIAASASLGATVDALGRRYAIGTSYSKARSTQFGGLTQSSLWSFALPQSQSFVALSQHLHAGVERVQGSVGVGYVYAQHPADRSLLRQTARALTLAGVPKGAVVTVQATMNRVFMDPIGDKGAQKLESYAESINARGQALVQPVGVALPQVTGAQLGGLVGREAEPKTHSALHVGVTYPLGTKSSVAFSATRASTGRSGRSVALNLQF